MVAYSTIILIMLLLGIAFVTFEALIPGSDIIVVGTSMIFSGLVGWVFPFIGMIGLLLTLIATSVLTYFGYKNIVDTSRGEEGETSSISNLEYSRGQAIERITSNSGRVKLEDGAGMSDKFQARTNVGTIKSGNEVVVSDASGGSVLEVVPYEDTD